MTDAAAACRELLGVGSQQAHHRRVLAQLIQRADQIGVDDGAAHSTNPGTE